MPKTKPPFKLAVSAVFLQAQELDAAQVAARLQPDYPGEKQFSVRNIDNALQSLKTVGILRATRESGESVYYELTSEGRAKVLKNL